MSLLHLTTSQRFATFPRRRLPNHHRSDPPGTLRRFPAARFTPLEGFPSSAAVPCHHGRCPPGVLLARSPRLPRPPFPETAINALTPSQPPSRLCSTDESVLSPHRFQHDRQPILPWALFPFKVPFFPFRPVAGKHLLAFAGRVLDHSLSQQAGFASDHRNPSGGCTLCSQATRARSPGVCPECTATSRSL